MRRGMSLSKRQSMTIWKCERIIEIAMFIVQVNQFAHFHSIILHLRNAISLFSSVHFVLSAMIPVHIHTVHSNCAQLPGIIEQFSDLITLKTYGGMSYLFSSPSVRSISHDTLCQIKSDIYSSHNSFSRHRLAQIALQSSHTDTQKKRFFFFWNVNSRMNDEQREKTVEIEKRIYRRCLLNQIETK